MACCQTTSVPVTGAVAVSEIAAKAKFKATVKKLLHQFNPTVGNRFVGAKPGTVLEHVTRRHFVDPFLQALGWDLTHLDEEVIEEAQTRGDATLRLDYLGVNQQTRVPMLIVEAKPWSAPFVGPSSRHETAEDMARDGPVSLICAAIEHHKSEGRVKDSPVTLQWARYLLQLSQYVESIQEESGHVVTRVAILSGQWLVIFPDPKAVFLTPGTVSTLLVKVYRGDEFVTQSDSVFRLLERRGFSEAIPFRIRPSLLPAYIQGKDVKRAFRAMWVSSTRIGAYWKPRPSLALYGALMLERRDGVMLTAVDDSLPELSIPHKYDKLGEHISAVKGQSDELLRRVNEELGSALVPSNIHEFPGFGMRLEDGSIEDAGTVRRVDLIRSDREPGEFVLVMGASKHFLLEAPIVDPCIFHDWGSCYRHTHGRGEVPIVFRSVKPSAFFVSGEQHHCAHQVVHDRRDARCQIAAFEEFLCCRACALQDYCWSEQECADLPCGTRAQTPVG